MPPLALTNAFGPNAPAKAPVAQDAEPVVVESVETKAETTKVKATKSKGSKSTQADA